MANGDLSAGLVYVGDGEWLPGVPARDLSPAEAREFAAVIGANAALTGRPLYAAATAADPARPAKAAEPARPATTGAANGAAGEE